MGGQGLCGSPRAGGVGQEEVRGPHRLDQAGVVDEHLGAVGQAGERLRVLQPADDHFKVGRRSLEYGVRTAHQHAEPVTRPVERPHEVAAQKARRPRQRRERARHVRPRPGPGRSGRRRPGTWPWRGSG